MNEPLVKGGQGRSASDAVSHSLLGTACIGLTLVIVCVGLAAQWAGWWAILTAIGLLILLACYLGCKWDRRRMAREMVTHRKGGNELVYHVGVARINGREVKLTDFGITYPSDANGNRLDVEA